MRYAIAAAIALVVGLVVGGALPRAEIRSLEHQVEELEARDCDGSAFGRELAGMFGPVRRTPPPLPEPEVVVEPIEPEPTDTDLPDTDPPGVTFDDTDAEQGLEAARSAMAMRRIQSRAALIEDARPTDDQLAEFDQAVSDMNADLRLLAEDLVARMDEGTEPSRRELMLYAADTLDVLIGADERMTGALDPDQLDGVDDGALDPFSHVDESILDLLSEIEPPQ